MHAGRLRAEAHFQGKHGYFLEPATPALLSMRLHLADDVRNSAVDRKSRSGKLQWQIEENPKRLL
jgi:hypothetical protein